MLGTGRPDFESAEVLLNIFNEPFDEVGRIMIGCVVGEKGRSDGRLQPSGIPEIEAESLRGV